jgi:hypothetical protein|tara:strand:- start:558 stop:713 length:156 start_codon:yes stop_codon:yes gene_type:complete
MPEKGNRDANRTFFGAIVFLSPHGPRFTTTTRFRSAGGRLDSVGPSARGEV